MVLDFYRIQVDKGLKSEAFELVENNEKHCEV